MQQRTYQTRLPGDPDRDAVLLAYAELVGRAERTLFARLQAGEPLAPLKRAFLVRFGLTARQFNALAAGVYGTIASVRKGRARLVHSLQRRIARAQRVLATIPTGTDERHQKRRRLATLRQRLAAVAADEAAGRVGVCFGSKTVFRKQFALAANGYASHRQWLDEWHAARASQFFVLGSRDERAGCQGCVATVEGDGTILLRLRLPNALAAASKYLAIPGLRFGYGGEAVLAAIGRTLSPTTEGPATISWRFVRDRKGWRVFATVSVRPGDRISTDDIGAIGVDLNANHVALSELDRFGNPVGWARVPCMTSGRSHHQRLAAIGEAIKQVVLYARDRAKPIVVERLDFEKRKAALEQRGPRYAWMLSSFAYAAFHAILAARAYDAGVALRSVNPAYTSVIGAYKFARRYGLSVHQAAACSIGRRGNTLAERPNRRMGDHVAFLLPARNRGKHVWSFWGQVARRAAARRARGRPGHAGPILAGTDSGDYPGTARRAIRSSPAGEIPARESSAASFG